MNRDQIADAMDAERAQIAQQIHDALLPLIFAASAAVQRQLDEFEQASERPGSDPERPGSDPERPGSDPERPGSDPERPGSDPERPGSDPERPGSDPERLRQALTWLQDALQIGRQILTQTHPPELAESSWDHAAQKTIAQLTDGNESPPSIQWQIDSSCQTLSDASARVCYRIVVEAVRNAIHHGQATQLTVTGTRENNELVVSIIDNGSGFDPDRVPEDRFGIRSMKGRAESVGGKVQLESKPGGPTSVRLSVPAQD